ncbi:hypothetical protein PPYR_12861 [Photinus pyralis]|uniref:Uncharacterized protein n=1 Tax=Photinus pyralis TaxID=7054 RepID=A0A5N4A7D9_PHOPY|nr:uncharacterized protein LOC116160853 [Photinus pyralis]KAB0791029.1 hypothetical protein PPYR_02829 [Photinus pyralis]KAB0793241.1 hypothetical protein PPYR_12861 [Photinus pyralis]
MLLVLFSTSLLRVALFSCLIGFSPLRLYFFSSPGPRFFFSFRHPFYACSVFFPRLFVSSFSRLLVCSHLPVFSSSGFIAFFRLLAPRFLIARRFYSSSRLILYFFSFPRLIRPSTYFSSRCLLPPSHARSPFRLLIFSSSSKLLVSSSPHFVVSLLVCLLVSATSKPPLPFVPQFSGNGCLESRAPRLLVFSYPGFLTHRILASSSLFFSSPSTIFVFSFPHPFCVSSIFFPRCFLSPRFLIFTSPLFLEFLFSSSRPFILFFFLDIFSASNRLLCCLLVPLSPRLVALSSPRASPPLLLASWFHRFLFFSSLFFFPFSYPDPLDFVTLRVFTSRPIAS